MPIFHVPFTVLVALAAQGAVPLPFEKHVELATGAPALCMMEYLITPGLECLPVYESLAPQLKGFPAELCSELASDRQRSRSAAVQYLARLAGMVRSTAWLRDRDEGEDLFAAALGKHAPTIRLGLEKALRKTQGKDRLLAAVSLLALTPDHRTALDTIIEEMRAGEPDRRRDACEWVGSARLAHPRLVTALATAIADKDAKVRGHAVAAVAQIGAKAAAAAPALIDCLRTGEQLDGPPPFSPWLLFARRNGGWLPLAELDRDGKLAVPMLIKRLAQDSAEERIEEFAFLAAFGPRARQAIATLSSYLTSGDDAERFAAGAAVLCVDPDEPSATKALTEGLKTHSKAVAACANTTPKVKALVPLLIDRLKDAAGTRENAAEALGNLGTLAEPAIPHLAALVTEKRGDVRCQFVAASALAKIGKASIPALEKILAKPGLSEGREAAAFVLGSFRGEAKVVVPLLIRALDDKNPVVRFNAAAALGRLRKAAAPARDALIRATRRKTTRDDVLALVGADMRDAMAKLLPAQGGLTDTFATEDAFGQTLALWALTQLDRE